MGKNRHEIFKVAIFMKSLKMTTLLYMAEPECAGEMDFVNFFNIENENGLKAASGRLPLGVTQHATQNRDPKLA